jgi:hypothetical protein
VKLAFFILVIEWWVSTYERSACGFGRTRSDMSKRVRDECA